MHHEAIHFSFFKPNSLQLLSFILLIELSFSFLFLDALKPHLDELDKPQSVLNAAVSSALFYFDFYRKGCVSVCLEMPTAVPAQPPGSTRPTPAADTKKHSHVHARVGEPATSSTCAALNRQKSGKRRIPAQLGRVTVEMSPVTTEPDPQRGVGDQISIA